MNTVNFENLTATCDANRSVNCTPLIYDGDCLGDLLEILDDLHTAASENKLHTFTTINKAELVGLLKDLIFTAQETIDEIETSAKREAKHGKRKQGQTGADASAVPTNIVPFVTPVPATAEALSETRQAR